MRNSSINHTILDLLRCAGCHYSAQEIYEHVRQKLPATNPSTVYRALERLVEAGLVSISDMGTGAAVYESTAIGVHHHLVCQVCGATLTLPHEQVDAFFASIETRNNFSVSTNHLVLFGLCQVCSQQKTSTSSG